MLKSTSKAISFQERILEQLIRRNAQCIPFEDLISENLKLLESKNSLEERNLQLSVQIEKLKEGEVVQKTPKEKQLFDQLQVLEQKLYQQQEELTDLHKRKSENSQTLLNLSQNLQKKEAECKAKNAQINELNTKNENLKANIGRHEKSFSELDNKYKALLDEYRVLQITYTSLNEKYRKVLEENRHAYEKLMRFKSSEIERINEENEAAFRRAQIGSLGSSSRKSQEKASQDTEAAGSASSRKSRESDASVGSSTYPQQASSLSQPEVPKDVKIEWNAHDSEINAVCWSPQSERMLATGGADRKIRLWEMSENGCELRKILEGSNAGIMAVDFDPFGNHILGASNDFACRMWSMPEWQLKKTYTGHSGKVLAAKFLPDRTKIVTGSHDRTLKLWDLNTITCTRTRFAGSSCNDLVISDDAGSTIISGHFDKKIRFWDTRADIYPSDIILNDKITSLDYSKNSNKIVCCVRDDTLKLLDLRIKKTLHSFSHEQFKVSCDWCRTVFSPGNDLYVAVGSANGAIFVWNTQTLQLQASLWKHSSAVTAVAWHPYGKCVVSVDRGKKAIIWSSN